MVSVDFSYIFSPFSVDFNGFWWIFGGFQEQMKLADAEDAEEGEQEDSSEAWKIFQKQFPKAAENEIYMTTPCREAKL